jgi:SM-20-related protein
MSRNSLLAKLGVLTLPDFLDRAECDRLIDEMRDAAASAALVSRPGADGELIDERARRTGRVQVRPETEAEIVRRLRATRAHVEAFFGLRLAWVLETPKFLRYEIGDFFVAHRDAQEHPDGRTASIIRARLVNLIVALNDETSGGGQPSYAGAGLTLYGLIDTPEWRRFGFPIRTAPGTLVAFRSSVVHEVAPVTRGTRYSVVSRMLDPAVPLDVAPSRDPGSPTGERP